MAHSIQIVCRDWKDLVCNRGNRCRYQHPPEIKQPDERLDICRDFQNRGKCSMGSTCKHLHLSIEQESTYYKTGELPEHGGVPTKVGLGRVPADVPNLQSLYCMYFCQIFLKHAQEMFMSFDGSSNASCKNH